ncbi:transposase [Candidatus Bathyarchaeota archaeon]|nr:transposase [Candidatus Bathyarchaeota archaeon]
MLDFWFMDWKAVDERLIRRGEILLSLGFLESYECELMALNRGRVGRPFKLTDRYVEFLTVVRYLFSMPYRRLEGFTRALNRLIRRLPSADYLWIRRRILTLNLSPYDSLRFSSGPIAIAVDSSGVSVHKSGGWVTRVYGGKKRYVKVHFAVDVETKEILAMKATTDDVHDSEAVMDGAYDNAEAYNLLRRMGVKPIIKPRRNARADRGPPERRLAVRLIRRLGDGGWAGMMGYGRRWAAETAFSTFKRQYGEHCMAKNMESIERELAAKAYIYNMLINL